MGMKSNVPAELIRDFVEIEMMKTFHIPPQVVSGIPYKWIEKYYLYERIKNDAVSTKNEIDKFKDEHSGKTRVRRS